MLQAHMHPGVWEYFLLKIILFYKCMWVLLSNLQNVLLQNYSNSKWLVKVISLLLAKSWSKTGSLKICVMVSCSYSYILFGDIFLNVRVYACTAPVVRKCFMENRIEGVWGHPNKRPIPHVDNWVVRRPRMVSRYCACESLPEIHCFLQVEESTWYL